MVWAGGIAYIGSSEEAQGSSGAVDRFRWHSLASMRLLLLRRSLINATKGVLSLPRDASLEAPELQP